jgi:hypothetical protein
MVKLDDVKLNPGDTVTIICSGGGVANKQDGNKKDGMMNLDAPKNQEGIMNVSEGGKRNRKGANKTRKNKQEGGKRKLSGYMKFANKVRPDLMKENPGMPIPKLGSAIGAKWRALSDAEKKSYA